MTLPAPRVPHRFRAAALVAALATALPATAQIASRKDLTLDGARIAIAAAGAEARKAGAGGVIAVVDAGGNLMALERLDGTFPAGARVSTGKARTAALFKRPTRFFEDVIKGGRTPMVALDDFTPLMGGQPILVDGEVVGAIGVSGAQSAAQDDELAVAGANAVSAVLSGGSPVTYLDATRVNASFAKGEPLLENGSFKVHASRRESAGQAEVHLHETDVIYVREGTATLVTGGTVTEPKTIAPGEIRGAAIANGEARTLAPGDVVVVPAGTPHWFRTVRAPFTYFVVKPH
ncbi:MAG: heme-binding protein [Acidobacteria bacterium]|nr:heme-binding protein [Acidobacteriota bacterium]